MSLICRAAGHIASAKFIENAGHRFSKCRRCGRDLIDLDGIWSTPPGGFRVVWKACGVSAPAPCDDVPQFEEPVRAPLVEVVPQACRRAMDRRVAAPGKLPNFLNGRDRRGGGNRRSFGSRTMFEASPGDSGENQLSLSI
jgi:hypothetical protein